MPTRIHGAAGAGHVAALRAKAVNAIATKQVSIEALEQRYGWRTGGWQDQLLRSADAATKKPDGKVSAHELDQYLANPSDAKFLTSAGMQRMRGDLNAAPGRGVDSFTASWENNVAHLADANRDGALAPAELANYFDRVKSGAGASAWMPDQKQQSYDDKIASLTGEADPLAVKETGKALPKAPLLSKEYMRIQMDEGGRIPQWVSYELSAADIAERPASVDRHGDPNNPDPRYRLSNPFHKDPELGGNAVSPYAYDGTGSQPTPFDKGHMKDADDSPNMEAMYETFAMSNMATQYGGLNQHSWACLEGAVNEMVQATGGKATIVTGNVYLDSKGKPLPVASRQMMKPLNGEPPIPVPTHCFKAVLLTLPDGSHKMFAYLVPNTKDVPTLLTQYGPMLRASRVSVDSIEKALGGADLFAKTGIPSAEQSKMESDSNSPLTFRNVSKYPNARVLWG
jgi:endonuclease G